MEEQDTQSNLITKIAERMAEFSKSQRLIGGFITQHYEQAAYMTASKLGSAVNVSESTVVRFAIEMGYEGYPEMQKDLQSYSKTRLTALQRLDITDHRIDQEHVLKSVLLQDIERIKSTVMMIDESDFEAAVDKILAADNIYIFGAMSSNALARFMDNYFQLIFDNVHFVRAINTSGIYQQLIRIGKNDVFIGFSFPRYCKSTASAARYAASHGAEVIAITDSMASPLGTIAGHVLLAKSDMVSFADSLVAPLSLINAIIAAVSIKKRTNIQSTLSRLEEMWDENGVYTELK
ncbi:MAG: MurR/RpiR family transcriptional regulator [Ruminococcaceae bacterium]|nr:MurR/RpiR family transcriptional regulator [Oscillospiraceae bacterium]